MPTVGEYYASLNLPVPDGVDPAARPGDSGALAGGAGFLVGQAGNLLANDPTDAGAYRQAAFARFQAEGFDGPWNAKTAQAGNAPTALPPAQPTTAASTPAGTVVQHYTGALTTVAGPGDQQTAARELQRKSFAKFATGGAVSGAGSLASIGAVLGPIGAIVGGIIGFLGGIFGGGGVPKAVGDAITDLRAGVKKLADAVAAKIGQVAHALSPIFQALSKIWTKVLKPLLTWLSKLAAKIKRIYDRILKPYLDALKRIRKIILDIYEKYFRPIIRIIEGFRQVLAILKLAHVKFAEDLDRKLQQLEGKLLTPIYTALKYVNVLGAWLNILLRADLVLQQVIFLRTLGAYKTSVGKYAASGFMETFPPAMPVQPVTREKALSDTRAYLLTGQGPNAELERVARDAANSISG